MALTIITITAPCNQPARAAEAVRETAPARLKVTLALGGGGTRGAAHIGVIRVLEQEHVPIDCIVGTSMGAIVGGLFAAGVSVDQIEKQMLNSKMLHAFETVPIPVRVAIIPITILPRLLGLRPYDGLYKGNKFRKFLLHQVPESRRNIEDLKMPFAAVCSNLIDAKAVAISSGNLGKAIQASSAIPFLRKPVAYGNQGLYVDGALEANLPVQQAKDLGGRPHRHCGRCRRKRQQPWRVLHISTHFEHSAPFNQHDPSQD